jgi:hypothetical protein
MWELSCEPSLITRGQCKMMGLFVRRFQGGELTPIAISKLAVRQPRMYKPWLMSWWVKDILGKESENQPAPSFIRFPSKFIKLPHHRPYQRPFSQRPFFKTPLGFRDCPMCTTTRGCRPRGPEEAWSFFGANYISTGHPSTNTTITLETTGVFQGFMEAISIHFLVVLGRASPLIQRTWLWRGDHISHITFHS